MSEHVQTCLNLFRFNMILIVTIHRILKHVWTCLDSIWYELIHFLNMSRLEMKTWWNTLKLSKWHMKCHWHWRQSYSLDRFEQVERSKRHHWASVISVPNHGHISRVFSDSDVTKCAVCSNVQVVVNTKFKTKCSDDDTIILIIFSIPTPYQFFKFQALNMSYSLFK